MVAMSGAIMPEPFAMPLSVTATSPISARWVASLGNVSVVMMARAASVQRLSAASAAIFAITLSNLDASSGSPMTPVEAMNTCSGAQPAASAANFAVASTASAPRWPVKALALPEFTTSALASPCWSCARHQSTGADAVLERVSTPPACVPSGNSASSTSVRPAYLIPASATANRTPGIGGNSASALGANGETLCICAMGGAKLLWLLRIRLSGSRRPPSPCPSPRWGEGTLELPPRLGKGRSQLPLPSGRGLG